MLNKIMVELILLVIIVGYILEHFVSAVGICLARVLSTTKHSTKLKFMGL